MTTSPTGPGARAVVSLVFITAASMVAQGFGRFTYPVLLDAINDDLVGSYARAGVLGTISLVAYLIGTAVVSVASTRVEPTTLVKLGLSGSLAGLVLLTVAPGFAVLAVGLFIAGLGGAGVWVPAPGIAASTVGAARSGLAIGLVGSGIGLGIVVAGPLTNAVRAAAGDDGAWRPVYGIEALVAAVVLIGVLVVVRVPSGAGKATTVRVGVLRSVPDWPWLVAAFAFFGMSYSLYFYFLVAELREAGWSASAASTIFAVVGLASATGGIAFGRLSDRYGRPRAMAVGFILLIVSPPLTLVGHPVAVVAAAVAFGLCVAGTPTTIGAVVADTLDGRAFGAAFGTLTLVFGVAQVLGPPFAGVMAETTGTFTVPFVAASVVACGGLGCAVALQRRGVRSREPATSAGASTA
ncbi:MAG: MFS transporter [Acidimicrobiales bacterium]